MKCERLNYQLVTSNISSWLSIKMRLYILTNTQIAHGFQATSVWTNLHPVLLICACVSEGLDTLHCIASSSRKHAKESSYFLFGMAHSPSLLYSNISYFLNYAMLDRKNGLSRKDGCTYTFFLYFQCWIKNRNIRATKSFCPGMRHSFFPSFPTSQLPPSPVAVGSKIWTHGLF